MGMHDLIADRGNKISIYTQSFRRVYARHHFFFSYLCATLKKCSLTNLTKWIM